MSDLAYVFWHWPAPGVDRPAYEQRLRDFHGALALPGSRTSALDRAPYDGEPPAPYEDWYPVAGWAALGELNDRAVSGARRAPHDAAAARAGTGAGGVMRRLQGSAQDHAVVHAAWLAKPASTSYAAFVDALAQAAGPHAAIWQRQMVLGPQPEFVVLHAAPPQLPWPATAVTARRL